MSRIIEQGGTIPAPPVRTSSAFSIDKDKLIGGIYRISTFLTAPSNVEDILVKILDEVVDSMGFDRGIILLLDESTSSLDGLNEQRMREAIDAVAAGRTLVVIAHRLSTVVDSDVIIVLDRGEVVGQGTHAELVASVPLYRELARHQLLV